MDSVNFDPASGIYATEAGPVELKVFGKFDDTPKIGEPADLEVGVTNKSHRSARDVEISVQPRSAHLFVKGSATREIGVLDGSATAHFTIGSTRRGELGVNVIATTPTGEKASAAVTTQIDEERNSALPLIATVVGASLAALATWLVRRGKQQEESK